MDLLRGLLFSPFLLFCAAQAFSLQARPSAALEELRRAAGAESLLTPGIRPMAASSLRRVSSRLRSEEADAAVYLPGIKDRHWTRADAFGGGEDRHFVSAHFDAQGNAYLSLMAAGWRAPLFYRFERDMNGQWEWNASRYSMDLDVSIWRARLNNIVRVRREGEDEPVYARRISDILRRAYLSGERLILGYGEYRIFFSNEIEASRSPARIIPLRQSVVFVKDLGTPDSPDYRRTIQPLSELEDGEWVRRPLPDGRTVFMRLVGNGTMLELTAN